MLDSSKRRRPFMCLYYYFTLKIGELAPATAFMTGKLKLSGDLSKALALESVLKAARENAEAQAGKRSYHTSTPKRPYYTTTPQL